VLGESVGVVAITANDGAPVTVGSSTEH
jgi:hypothetical protein